MKNIIYIAIALIIVLSTQACINERKKDEGARPTVDNKTFLKDGIDATLTEIKASGLAITNSSNLRVIGLAKLMIDDHTGADSILRKMEADQFPGERDTISIEHQKVIVDLEKQSGAAFDKAYVQLMINDHQATVQLFNNATNSEDKAISGFATQTLPVIKMHLDSALSVAAALK
jgi:putative membrane protein